MDEKVKGNLIIIGGAEDKEHECKILNYVVDSIKAKKNSLLIITTATQKPQQVFDIYKKVFKRLGVDEIETLDISDREDANDKKNVEKVYDAGGIFFSGGDQLRITSILGGTRVNEALIDVYRKGTVIAGTSAGASAMSSTMIVDGEADTPKKTTLSMAPGLAFINEVVIDQHFAQRGRIGRLLYAVAQNPYTLGIGIDEDTAIAVDSNGLFQVIGTNSVTVLDAKNIRYSNISELSRGDVLELIGVTLHVLSPGSGFDLAKREPILKGGL